MTKTEFREQFKRLRLAGYRLPVFDGVTIEDVMTEWFDTFHGCTAEEFSEAIARLKQQKTDTWWPATGEIWSHIFEVRKARRIRRQSEDVGGVWQMSEADTQAFLGVLRAARDKILGKMTMPKGVAQEEPQAVQDERALREEDDRINTA